ncbi:hypothetical protein Fmac_018343 [Flemingia macrophylla]|uniref:Uncharacterized protein n=1 Tax=Flemingia macrophylla TaxID=520843 RepID=A0ABD1M4Q1_9FABA
MKYSTWRAYLITRQNTQLPPAGSSLKALPGKSVNSFTRPSVHWHYGHQPIGRVKGGSCRHPILSRTPNKPKKHMKRRRNHLMKTLNLWMTSGVMVETYVDDQTYVSYVFEPFIYDLEIITKLHLSPSSITPNTSLKSQKKPTPTPTTTHQNPPPPPKPQQSEASRPKPKITLKRKLPAVAD